MKRGKSPVRSDREIAPHFFVNVHPDIYQCSYGFYIALTNCCMNRGQGILRDRQQDYFYWSDLSGYVLPERRHGPYDRKDENEKECKDAFHGRILLCRE